MPQPSPERLPRQELRALLAGWLVVASPGSVETALRNRQYGEATAGFTRLQERCTRCHDAYRR